MALGAEVGGWPALSFGLKKADRCPVVKLSTLCVTNFADAREGFWGESIRLKSCSVNGSALREQRKYFAAVATDKGVFSLPAGIDVEAHSPCCHSAILARGLGVVNFIFPRGVSHEVLSILWK